MLEKTEFDPEFPLVTEPGLFTAAPPAPMVIVTDVPEEMDMGDEDAWYPPAPPPPPNREPPLPPPAITR
jgi:hypothetical protein